MSEEFMKSHFESNYSNIGHRSPQFKVIMLCEKNGFLRKQATGDSGAFITEMLCCPSFC